MTIYKAFIIEASSAVKTQAVRRELVKGDRLYMPVDIRENGGKNRLAVIFHNDPGDDQTTFEQVAALISSNGDARLPSDKFRDLNTFAPWPSKFATIEAD